MEPEKAALKRHETATIGNRGMKENFLDVIELIRSIQRAE
jgi:hypothetical protein